MISQKISWIKKIDLCLHKICGLWQMPWFILSFFYLWTFSGIVKFCFGFVLSIGWELQSYFSSCVNVLQYFVCFFIFWGKKIETKFFDFLVLQRFFCFLFFFNLEKLGGNLFAIFLGLNLIILFKNSLGIELPLGPFTQSFKGFEWEEKKGR